MHDIRSIINRVDHDRIRDTVFHLAKSPLPFRTLNCTLPGHEKCTLHEADDHIEGLLRAAGYDVRRSAYQVKAFRCDRTKPLHHWYGTPAPDAPLLTAYNLEATRQGLHRPAEIIQLAAHKDSQSWIECPGALDNAVGTAVTIEIARVLAEVECRRTVRFLWCNEEHTPWTSAFAANEARDRGDDIVAMINVDSLAGKSDEDLASGRKTNVTGYSCDEGRRIADLMDAVNERCQIGLEQRSFRREFVNDDDGSFVNAGFLAAVVNCGSSPYADSQYHLAGDVPERVDYENVWMAAKLTLAAVLELDAED